MKFVHFCKFFEKVVFQICKHSYNFMISWVLKIFSYITYLSTAASSAISKLNAHFMHLYDFCKWDDNDNPLHNIVADDDYDAAKFAVSFY